MTFDDWSLAYILVGVAAGTCVHISRLKRDADDDYEMRAVITMLLWPVVASVMMAAFIARHAWPDTRHQKNRNQ